MARARWLSCLAALAASVACHDSAPAQPRLNRCTQAFECTRGDRCDPLLGICVHEKFERPYDTILLVIPASQDLTRATTRSMLLTEPTDVGSITARRAVTVRGVIADSTSSAFSAEVAFIPQLAGYLSGSVSAFTKPASSPDGGVPEFAYDFEAALEPNVAYDVRVFPLGAASERLPPRSFTLERPDESVLTRFDYLPVRPHSATLLDENEKAPPAGSKLRLRDKLTKEIVSSIGKPDAQGRFDLDVTDEVWNGLAAYELLLEVPFGDAPQTVSIVLDASQLDSTDPLTMPVVPAAVLYSFTVDADDPNDKVSRGLNADVTFVSTFEPPTSPNDVRQRDWCRLRLSSGTARTFTCGATIKASSVDGAGLAKLLPGDYQAYVSPSGDSPLSRGFATKTLPVTISSQPNGVQEGQSLDPSPAAVYEGSVVSALKQSMPAVTVAANALGVSKDLGALASYNRTVDAVSDRHGRFQLAVDTGYYDLIAIPPENSGYAWVVNYSREIVDSRREEFLVEPQTPVIVRGTVLSEALPDGGMGGPLEARIEAFAIVPDLDTGAPRAVRIARANSDSRGGFALALPPYIGDPPELAPADAGAASLDVGASGR